MNKKNILWLDSFRGIACMIVVVAHIVSTHSTIGKYASGCGKIGVWCFMVLSAYLLYRPYCSENRKFGWRDLGEFYIKRVIRIFPVYLVALIFSYVIGYFPTVDEILYHLIGVHGAGHFWYMPVIMKFYLVMPLFLWMRCKLHKEKSVVMLLLLMGISLVWKPYTEYIENSTELWWYLPVFFIGMLLAEMVSVGEKRKIKKAIWYDIVTFICVIVGILFMPYVRERVWGIAPSGWLQNKYLLYGSLWAIIILCISCSKYMKAFLEKAKVLGYIGKVSFGVYLFHYPVLMKLSGNYESVWINGIITIISSIALATVVRYGVEKPIEKVKRKIM